MWKPQTESKPTQRMRECCSRKPNQPNQPKTQRRGEGASPLTKRGYDPPITSRGGVFDASDPFPAGWRLFFIEILTLSFQHWCEQLRISICISAMASSSSRLPWIPISSHSHHARARDNEKKRGRSCLVQSVAQNGDICQRVRAWFNQPLNMAKVAWYGN